MTKEYPILKVPVGQVKVNLDDAKPPSGHFPPDSARFDELKNELARNGMLVPVFVDSQKTIISGHYRYWAARELKWKEVPIVVVENYEDALRYVEG